MGHTVDYYTSKAGSEKSLKLFIDSVTAHAYESKRNKQLSRTHDDPQR